MCGGLLLYKGARMATAKKPSKKTAKAEVSRTEDIITEFGSFRIGKDGAITQTVFPKAGKFPVTGNNKCIEAIADLTAVEVEALIRSQA